VGLFSVKQDLFVDMVRILLARQRYSHFLQPKYVGKYISYKMIDFGVQRHFQQYFSYIVVTSFSVGKSRSTRREPLTMGNQLINFITCGCESSSPFFVIYKAGREPTPY
jgi:hypothetical protein